MSTNLLWAIYIHVGRGSNRQMPPNLQGATVAAFVGAPDSDAAARKIATAVARRGFEFIDIVDRRISQLDPASWEDYVREYWPDHAARFVPQSEIAEFVRSGKVFFGPFAGYESRHGDESESSA